MFDFNKISFHLKEFDIKSKYRLYEKHINDIENKLSQESDSLEKQYKKAIAEAGSKEYEDSIQSHFEELWNENSEIAPMVLYGSLFLSLYAYFEGTFKYCYEECVALGYPQIEAKKKGIIHYKGFFNKNGLYDFSKDHESFKRSEDYAIIRDKLIHTNGEMTSQELESIKPVLDRHASIDVKSDSFVIVDKRIVVELNKTIYDILVPMCRYLYGTIEPYKTRGIV